MPLRESGGNRFRRNRWLHHQGVRTAMDRYLKVHHADVRGCGWRWRGLCAAIFVTVLLLWGAGRVPAAEPAPVNGAQLVELKTLAPDILLDIRYATANNFTGKPVYPSNRCFLAKPAAEALARVAEALRTKELRLTVFDGYRPLSVQKRFWKILPDPRYVADPAVGSKHNRGYAVDVSLADPRGKPLIMPTGYDDFTEKAHADYADLPAEAVRNRATLRTAMEEQGFTAFPTEWWHFDYKGWEKQPVLDISIESLTGGKVSTVPRSKRK